jgi:hypothetical protein
MNEQHLTKLSRADGAAINSYHHQHEPSCLPDTRVDLLRQIKEWSNNLQGKCIFWLSGLAGTGKSTIARTIAREGSKQNNLEASFFFSRNGSDRAHARMLFSTLALQLAEMSPILKRHISEAIAENPDIAQRGLPDQWQKLLFKPLSRLNTSQIELPNILLIIDALDECEDHNDVDLVLRLLTQTKDLTNVRLRIFITSRPEGHIQDSFEEISPEIYQSLILHNVSRSTVNHDISILFKHELKPKATRKKRHGVHINLSDEENVQALTKRADGLFIYAATACRYIMGSGRETTTSTDRLSQVLRGEGFSNLEKMYAHILEQCIIGAKDEWERDILKAQFEQILGVIATSFDLLSATALSELCSMELEMVWERLDSLQSVLVVPESESALVQVFHPSFRNFLLNKRRYLDNQFWIDEKVAHQDLFNSSMRLMSNDSTGLRRDICDIYHPGTEVSKIEGSRLDNCLPIHARYACRYWVDHLERVDNSQREELGLCDNGKVYVFLQKHFLHWLEALSLIGSISKGIFMVNALESMLTVSDSSSATISLAN